MRTLHVILLTGLLTGCASLAEGTIETSERLLLTSAPSGAAVRQQNRTICSTPCYTRRSDLRSGEGFVFQWPGGEVIEVEPSYDFQAAVLGNIIFGGGVGLVIDTATGRAVGRPDHIHVELAANRARPLAAD
jgi:hypothetical protein